MKRKKKRELPKDLFVDLVSGERDPPSMRFRETTQSLTMKNSNSHFQERTILGSHSDLNRTLSKPFWKPQNPPILHWFHSFTFIHFPTFSLPKRMIYCAYSIGEDEATACRLRAILDPRSSFLLSDCDSFLDPQSQYRLVFPSVKQRFVRSIHQFLTLMNVIRFFPHFKHNKDKLCRGYGFTSVLTIENYSTSDKW